MLYVFNARFIIQDSQTKFLSLADLLLQFKSYLNIYEFLMMFLFNFVIRFICFLFYYFTKLFNLKIFFLRNIQSFSK